MEYPGELKPATTAGGLPQGAGPDGSGLGHPTLAWFDEIRALFARTGLPPEPEIYELLYHHVSGADAALSREVERVLSDGPVTPEQVKAIRRAHFGDIAASELQELLEGAQGSAEGLARGLDRGLDEVSGYDDAVADEDIALGVARTAEAVAEIVQRLRRSNATMMIANRRLEADIRAARLEIGRLLDRLDVAEAKARRDPLTGLLNRRGLLEALKKAQASALESGTQLSAALVDIDHFRRVNDQWGHAIGDEVLRCVAGHLASHARRTAGDGAFAGRHGGEEFLVALPGMALREAAAAIDTARAILARQVLRRSDDGASLGHVSFSAGVATLRADDSAESLIDRADAALFAAKRTGRDRVLPELPCQ
jgi:diguanylate cyclase